VPKSLLLISGIFPPDSGGPAKFAMEFGKWASIQSIRVQIQTYADETIKLQDFSFYKLSAASRTRNVFFRYIQMVVSIGTKATKGTSVLSVGAFLETYLASILFRFSYVAKVPGDIVWERARNNHLTSLGINEFQNQKLSLKYRAFRNLYTKSLTRARIVIVPSMGLYKLCLRWGVSESKLRLIYNSVEIESGSNIENTKKRFDLITVCRLASWKGVDEIIEYTSQKGLNLLVLGDGPDRARLESLAKQLDANVIFEGEVPPQDVHKFLLQSRLFVLNSYYEGLPHALVEARATGVLSVGRAGTGSEEVINDDIDGFLIRQNRSLRDTLDSAFNILPSAASMISKARSDAAQRFSKSNNFPKIFNLIKCEN
jgi:glycosyltransferase involved in cell wall biosynthesis